MSTVYAEEPFVYVWSGPREVHKQGKTPANTPLVVISEAGKWLEIKEPPLDREVKPGYPNFWVKKEDVNAGPVGPVPQPDPPVSVAGDLVAGQAFVVLYRWMVDVFKGRV